MEERVQRTVEVARWQGGFIVRYHVGMVSKTIGHYYGDLDSYRAAVEQAKQKAKDVGAEYLDNT